MGKVRSSGSLMSTIRLLFFELITWDKTKALLDARHPETELVFTGRGAPQELIDEGRPCQRK